MKSQLLYFSLFLAACGAPEAPKSEHEAPALPQEVNIYSHRHYDVDKDLYAKFTEITGIKVNVVNAEADELMTRLEQEGENSPCDIFYTADAGRLGIAQQRGLLQPSSSKVLEANIPAHYRQDAGYWYGLTMRARVVAYDKAKVKPDEIKHYSDLVLPRFKGKVLVRSSENIYNQSLLAAMIAHDGRDKALAWASGIKNNMARDPKSNDTGQMLAVAEGLGQVAIVNSYYIGKLMSSEEPDQKAAAAKLGVAFPSIDDYGTHVNISGAGIAKHAPHKEAAIQLLEFLSSEEAQGRFAEGNKEFPVNPNVKAAAELLAWGEFKADQLPLQKLAEYNADAVKLFDMAGWK